jgi:arylsulfatase A-like enzyme/Tfp pilus assembly protein PilF
MARVGGLALAGLAVAVLIGCSQEFRPGPDGGVQNFLLVTFDTTRADRIGCYGYEPASTPIIDGLAREGVLFERCFAPTPITLPSHSTLLTGFQPYTHGARNNGTHKVSGAVRSIAERLKEQGFATGAVVSSFVLNARFGLDSGFDSYDDDLSGGTGQGDFGYAETRANDTTRRAQAWLNQRGDERWFLWVHYFDPHSDYSPPEPYRSRCPGEPYDGEIAYTDAMLGVLLESLRRRGDLAETLVVLTADHGEALGDHGENTHGVFIYDSTTHVPLVMSHPGLPVSTRVDQVIGLVDIAPTALELLGVPYGADFDGRSFVQAMLAPEGAFESQPAYSESLLPRIGFGWAELRALRGEDWRYVRAPRSELYDLSTDPGELHNLASAEPERLGRKAAELEGMLPETETETYTRDTGGMDPEVEAALAHLGYAGSDLSGGLESGLPDPKDKIGDTHKLHEAEAAQAAGDVDRAEALYRELIEDNPNSIDARNPLADMLTREERFREAIEVQRQIVRLPAVKSVNFIALAQLEDRIGEGDVSATLQLAKACDARDPMPWVTEGSLVHWPEDPTAAMAAFRKALEIDPRCAKAWVGVCEIEASRRRLPEAIAAAEEAVACDPSLHAPWFHMGTMNAASGKHREAIRCLTRAREIDPKHLHTRLGLTMLHITLGERAQAQAQLREAAQIDRVAVERMAAGNPGIARVLRELN